MDINTMMQNNIASLQQSINIATLSQTMHQDASSVNNLLQSMDENTKAVQRAAQPHLGANIDIRV